MPWKCQSDWHLRPIWSIIVNWCAAKIVPNCCDVHSSNRLAIPPVPISPMACATCNWIRCQKVRQPKQLDDEDIVADEWMNIQHNTIQCYFVILISLFVSFRQFAVHQNHHRTSCEYFSGIFYHNVRIPYPCLVSSLAVFVLYRNKRLCIRLRLIWIDLSFMNIDRVTETK